MEYFNDSLKIMSDMDFIKLRDAEGAKVSYHYVRYGNVKFEAIKINTSSIEVEYCVSTTAIVKALIQCCADLTKDPYLKD